MPTGRPGLYLHFPFCLRKCLYCDFNSREGDEAERALYLQALRAEIARKASADATADTVYFGGGTPTLYPPGELASLLELLRESFPLQPDAEVTCEANPGTVTAADLADMRRAGFNRLSLGVQSLRDDELRLLGRIHDSAQARAAVRDAREAGFTNLSLDLLRGLPGQTLEQWLDSLEGAISLAPEHISVYGLLLEEGTPLWAQACAGCLPPLVGGDAPGWVQTGAEWLARAGYERYEISNYARPGFASRHNLNYWRNGDYLGFGAGAWSYVGGERRRNLPDVAQYTRAALAGDPLVAEAERLAPEAALGETVMLGLRTVAGVNLVELRRRFGVHLEERHGTLVAELVAAGLALREGDRLRLTDQGLLVQSAIAARFLA